MQRLPRYLLVLSLLLVAAGLVLVLARPGDLDDDSTEAAGPAATEPDRTADCLRKVRRLRRLRCVMGGLRGSGRGCTRGRAGGRRVIVPWNALGENVAPANPVRRAARIAGIRLNAPVARATRVECLLKLPTIADVVLGHSSY